jgi:3-deoxy-D-manno-octulosonic-acid transferase
MLYFVYDIFLFLAVPLILPYYLFRWVRRGRLRKGIGERLGFLPAEKRARLEGGETLWVHAVSVGETMAVRPLLKALKDRYPEKKIVLSTVTETGRSIAENLADVDICIYFPFDFGFAVRRMLKAIGPSLIVVVETEIWPNFLRNAHLSGIPTVLANGRISDKSFGGYLRFSWAFRPVLENFDALCMQTGEDARRIVAIGALPARVHVAKNLKYDIPVCTVSAERKSSMRAAYHIPQGMPVFTAGSTHQGEEEAVLAAFRTLVNDGRDLLLILVPRHPERAEEVGKLAAQMGIPYVRRSSLAGSAAPFRSGEVLLVDTVGELMGIYSISDLVFVGGSLVPVGGHNLLEPASLAVPVIFGPHMNNFREIASRILQSRGGVQVQDVSGLSRVVRQLLDSPEEQRTLGGNGAAILTENCGSTQRHMAIISAILSRKGAAPHATS